jgi:hypothetical protein
VRHRPAAAQQHAAYLILSMTPTGKRPTPRPPTGEQWVAAMLVGAVVILLGFASGLGLSPASTSQPAADGPQVVTRTVAPPAGTPAGSPTPSAAPPVAYVLPPIPAAPPTSSAAAATTGAPSSGTGTPNPTTSSAPTPAASSSAAPSTGCRPALLANLLGALLPETRGPGLLGLGPLLGALSRLTTALTGAGVTCHVTRVTVTATASTTPS